MYLGRSTFHLGEALEGAWSRSFPALSSNVKTGNSPSNQPEAVVVSIRVLIEAPALSFASRVDLLSHLPYSYSLTAFWAYGTSRFSELGSKLARGFSKSRRDFF
jgi:hypothetical protein